MIISLLGGGVSFFLSCSLFIFSPQYVFSHLNIIGNVLKTYYLSLYMLLEPYFK